jgi:2-polyprenyl-3-methyl-5-hydroxy-6-metoxy-1,4-benzoquinol methylase
VSERYRADDDAPREYEDWLRALRARLPAQADVLDLGCGCGVPMTRRLTHLGHQVLGVDVSSVQIDRARQLVPRARFIQADASELLFDPASFDAIVCLYVLIHLAEQEQRALVESFRTWLRPGGVLVATVGARAWTGEEADWLGGRARMWWSNPGADTYREWLGSAGLTIEHDGSGIVDLCSTESSPINCIRHRATTTSPSPSPDN